VSEVHAIKLGDHPGFLRRSKMGIFVCTGGFTSDAESEARTKETRKLTLLDLEKLVDLWVSNYEKIEAPLFGMTLL
jgi:restriction endonuclease Mrr